MRIAVIGAGLAGLTLSRALLQSGFEVSLFEKARGVGGRMAARYAEPYFFDHGAQFFTARNPEFQSFLAPYIAGNMIIPWTGKIVTLKKDAAPFDRLWFEPHYVPVPHMNALCKVLAEECRALRPDCIAAGVEIAPLSRTEGGWSLRDKDNNNLGIFDWVVSSAPPVQTLRLFGTSFTEQAASLKNTRMRGCFTLMAGLNDRWPLPWAAASIQDSLLGWVAVNGRKRGQKPATDSLVIQSTNDWAETHLEFAEAEVKAEMMAEFRLLTGYDLADAPYLSLHRWRYADTQQALGEPFGIDARAKLACCGDWCLTGKVESAWESSAALAAHLKKLLIA